jgi:hypothetical protein
MVISAPGKTLMRTCVFGLIVSLTGGGCGEEKMFNSPLDPSAIPVMPKPMPGQATLAGLVLDRNGQPVAGATVRIAETNAVAQSDAAGAYQIAVPSDSTVTLATTAMGFATTYRESVVVASGVAITGFDVLVLPNADVVTMNAFGAAAQASTGGLTAVRLHRMDTGCVTDGAVASLWPTAAGTVVYSRPSGTGGLDEPDPTLTSVQPGAQIALWLSGTISPGAMLTIRIRGAGCQVMAAAPSLNGLVYQGQRRVDALALTQAEIFLTVVR